MKKISVGVIVASMLLIPALSFAQTSDLPQQQGSFPSSGSLPAQQGSVPGVSPYNTSGTSQFAVHNPLGTDSVCGLIKKILQAAIAIGIPIAVLFIVYAGFKFVLAQGKPEDLAAARQNFMWTLIGIGIFLGAWLLAVLIANTVNGLAAGTGANGNSSLISCQ